MEPAEYLTDATVIVSEERYAVCKTEQAEPTAFATVRDGSETTVVIEQESLDDVAAIETERDWKLLTFDVVLPFELVGFLATVAGALAEEGVSIFALSAYSTDHLLVKSGDVDTATRKLERLGCEVRRES